MTSWIIITFKITSIVNYISYTRRLIEQEDLDHSGVTSSLGWPLFLICSLLWSLGLSSSHNYCWFPFTGLLSPTFLWRFLVGQPHYKLRQSIYILSSSVPLSPRSRKWIDRGKCKLCEPIQWADRCGTNKMMPTWLKISNDIMIIFVSKLKQATAQELERTVDTWSLDLHDKLATTAVDRNGHCMSRKCLTKEQR